MYMGKSLLIFSDLICKWLPGGHIRFFGFWMAWLWQRNSSLLWNFSFKFHVHVLCGCRQKAKDCQLCRFQNGCLVILNNVQLQSTHCPLPPSPMGRGYPSRSLIYNFELPFSWIEFICGTNTTYENTMCHNHSWLCHWTGNLFNIHFVVCVLYEISQWYNGWVQDCDIPMDGRNHSLAPNHWYITNIFHSTSSISLIYVVYQWSIAGLQYLQQRATVLSYWLTLTFW